MKSEATHAIPHPSWGARRPHEPIPVVRAKGSDRAFSRLLKIIQESIPGKLPRELKEVLAIGKQTEARLAGQKHREWSRIRNEDVDMDGADACRLVSSPDIAVLLLWISVRARRPKWCVEFGSAFGLGTMSIALAAKSRRSSRLDSIEYDPGRASIALNNLTRVCPGTGQVHQGRIEDVFPPLATRYGLVDFAFVDAVHKFDDTRGYHLLLRETASEGCIAIYDDIHWSPGMGEFWKVLLADDAITDAALINSRWGLARYKGRAKP